MKCKCNAKSLLRPVFHVFRATFTMPGRNPPASTRRGKGFTKAETTTLLKAVERILPIDAEGWNEVHEIFNSKHSSRGVEGLKRKFNKLANKPVPTGNPNIPEDVKLAKSIKGKLFRRAGATNLSDKEEEEEEDEEEEELDDDVATETADENIPSQPLITEAEVQEILNNEEEENNSAIAVEVSEEVTDTQAAVVAPPESSPTTAMQQGTPSLNRLATAAAQSSLTNQRVLQTGIRHGATRKKQRVESSKADSGMGDMLEIMKMDMMSQMQQRHDQRESERERREDERIRREEERSRREEERSRRDEDSQFMRMMMMAMMGNMRNPSPNTNANTSTENNNDLKRKAEEKQEE